MYVCNVDEACAVTGNKYVDAVREAVKDEGAADSGESALRSRAEIAELDTYEENASCSCKRFGLGGSRA